MGRPLWKPIPRFPGYEASEDGRIRSVDRTVAGRFWPGCELRTFPNHRGYLGGNVSINGRRANFEVHVLVCEAFHGPRPEGLEVRHLNGVPTDNRACNLAWGTRSENQQDIIDHGHHHQLNKDQCPQGHPYDAQNTYRSPGSPNKRQCRICRADRDRARPSGSARARQRASR